MKFALPAGLFCGALALAASLGFVHREVSAAGKRLAEPARKDPALQAAVADHTEAPYCTPQFKEVLQRVINACGLAGQESRRGCQPADVKTLASISDDDFNALFTPLAQRGAILLFDDASEKLDEDGKKLLAERWEDRRGARYFFVVARASKSGTAEMNRALSHKRANSVQFFLQERYKEQDPELDKKIGLLWLGKEFAQLTKSYCADWAHSHEGKPCNEEAINRSAFISWVDCRL
jgi:outer membrane protein OmpA-like peptidoglycan-associated protein